MTKQKASPRHILLFAGAGYVVAMIGMNWPASRAADSHPKLVDQARVQRLQEAAKLPEADKRAMHRDLYYPDGFLPYGNLSEFRPYGKLWNYRRGTDQFFEGSNASPSDYVGAESCRECHEKQHDGWMHHAHRKMNALATKETVLGDFSGKAVLPYLGGEFRFHQEDGGYLMTMERGGIKQTWQVTQTIGSRFLQTYVGRMIEGNGQPFHFSKNHVLPGVWRITKGEWVPRFPSPVIAEDGNNLDYYTKPNVREYSADCAICHVTIPIGQWFARIGNAGTFFPRRLEFDAVAYMKDTHAPTLAKAKVSTEDLDSDFQAALSKLGHIEPSEVSVNLGISCEACHLGCREHIEDNKQKPRFGPVGPQFRSNEPGWEESFGRTVQNLNWTCGRCHSASVDPMHSMYEWGMSATNSSEFTDAHRGNCYSELTCVHCHDPHTTTGLDYRQSPIQDDQLCLSCHFSLSDETAQAAHTHHPISSEGSRCMNCHMPRITEGIEDMVRTHAIHSPSDPEFFRSNQPNACNLCHLDKSLQWTMNLLRRWYKKEGQVPENQRAVHEPASISWLKSRFMRTRQAAGWALAHHANSWAMPHILDTMNDSNAKVRQYTETSLERTTGLDFSKFGYAYWQTPEERKMPLAKIRAHLLSDFKNRDGD